MTNINDVVVAIVATEEFQRILTVKDGSPRAGVVSYDFVKEECQVGTYYSYLLDSDFGGVSRSPVCAGRQGRLRRLRRVPSSRSAL